MINKIQESELSEWEKLCDRVKNGESFLSAVSPSERLANAVIIIIERVRELEAILSASAHNS